MELQLKWESSNGSSSKPVHVSSKAVESYVASDLKIEWKMWCGKLSDLPLPKEIEYISQSKEIFVYEVVATPQNILGP